MRVRFSEAADTMFVCERVRFASGGQIRFGLRDRRFVVARAHVARGRDQLLGARSNAFAAVACLPDIEQARRQVRARALRLQDAFGAAVRRFASMSRALSPGGSISLPSVMR